MARYFDLHCDTLLACMDKEESPLVNSFAIATERLTGLSHWVQCFAAFVHDDKTAEEGVQLFHRMADIFDNMLQGEGTAVTYTPGQPVKEGVCNAVLTVEGGRALGGDLANIERFRARGVQMLSLVWSNETDLAGGVTSASGLKPLGQQAVRELEQNGIILDVSHMNDKSFWDAAKVAKKPFIASHSNAFAVCAHPRNLKDEQIKEIVARGGLIGLNYCVPFIVEGAKMTPDMKVDKDATYEDIARHIEHMLALGGEKVIACGSDFDGAPLPSSMTGIETMPAFAAFLEQRFGKELADAITYGNAKRYFESYK